MKRRKFFKSTLFSVAGLIAVKNSTASGKGSDDWKITMLNKNIGIFTESGGTILFHLSKDGITVVDAQFPTSAPHLIAELKKKNMPFHLLINTHHHRDHTSGNISFKGLVSRVLAHENSLANQKRVAENNHTEEKQYYPTQTFSKQWSENAGDETIELTYYGPAHTDGDIVVYFKNSRIAHVGDLVFNRRHPLIDHSAGASMQHWIKVLTDIRSSFDPQTIFVCGHSGNNFDVTGNINMLKDFQSYLENSLHFVSDQIKSGKAKEEILKAKEIPGSPDWKGDGIERTLNAAYEELTKS